MSGRVSYIGEITLTDEGRKHHEEVSKKLKEQFRVLNDANGTIFLNGEGAYRKAKIYDLLALLTGKRYIASGYINFHSEEDYYPWRLRYMPVSGRWQEFESHTVFEDEIFETAMSLVPEKKDLVLQLLEDLCGDGKKEGEKGTKTISVTAYPYAVQYGEIEVPKDLPLEKIQDYIRNHWNEISFGEPELDYCGTDFEFDDEDDI